jgi:methionyl-tRNA formyltransferase
MRLLYFGMGGILSLAPLQALLRAGRDVRAVIVPATASGVPLRQLQPDPSPSQLPMASSYLERDVVHLAWENQIATYEAGDLSSATVQREIEALAPDLACVSCFSRRIPAGLLALPRHGFLNVHPSLLPDYRGPFPLFWQLRDGLRQSGVTVHFMDEQLDSGDIALQQALPLAAGSSGAELQQLAGEIGGKLLLQAIDQIDAGTLERRPQPPGGSYQPAPHAADFTLDLTWSAEHAFNFMCGTAHWGHPYPLYLPGGQQLRLRTAVAFEAERELAGVWKQQGSEVHIQFAQGVLRATLV